MEKSSKLKLIFQTLYKYWMKFAHVLGWVNTRIILTVFYIVIITPVSLLLRVFKKDLLDLDFKKSEESYWNKKEIILDRERYLKPY